MKLFSSFLVEIKLFGSNSWIVFFGNCIHVIFQDVSRALLKFDPFNKKHITQFMLKFSGLLKNNYELSMCARKTVQTSLRMGRLFIPLGDVSLIKHAPRQSLPNSPKVSTGKQPTGFTSFTLKPAAAGIYHA